jgi:hypothetical protein
MKAAKVPFVTITGEGEGVFRARRFRLQKRSQVLSSGTTKTTMIPRQVKIIAQ